MSVSVMITTRNRCADLKRTLEVLSVMNPQADEILITADGCTDGTVEMVRTSFPNCRLRENIPGLGSVPSRDAMLREADGDLVVSLDDDSYPVSPDFFRQVTRLFESRPEVAVMTFPELRDDGGFWPLSKTPECPGHYVSAYPNGAAVMRRSAYLQTAGYPLFFMHSYEEPDYAAQCYEHGMAVWFEPSLVIRHHFSSVNRNELQTHLLNARNELWSVWIRCPWPWLPFVSTLRIFRQFCYACTRGWDWVSSEPSWWWRACQGRDLCRQARRPIPWRRYFAWMLLARRPLRSVGEWQAEFDNKPRS